MARSAPRPRYSEETIHLVNLRVECIIGVNPDERVREQPLIVSLSFPASFAAAARNDDLRRTVNYSEVAEAIRAFARAGQYRLLETLARRLAAHLGARFGLARLSLHLRKPQAVAGSDGPAVSLTFRRGRR